MQLEHLKRHTAQKDKKRIGRGGKRGTYSGRGIKGQNARAGTSGRNELLDMIKKLPKRRGYGMNRSRTVHDSRVRAIAVNVATIDKHYVDGETVNAATLAHKGIVNTRGGKLPLIKVLASGEIIKKLKFENVAVSEAAKKKIESAGGTIA
ncbi:MAG: uL15 family ribosomal protein [bacterium]|nr:uL15 family ribosomal protein [bacterium]